MDKELETKVQQARAWTGQILAQMFEGKPWTVGATDPLGELRKVNDLRADLASQGYEVPAIVEVEKDPVRNMREWNAYLTKIAPTN